MARRRSSVNPQDVLPPTIQRKAINLCGEIGSLYNAHRDYVLEQLDVSDISEPVQSFDPRRCEVIKGNTQKSDDLLPMIGIEDDLRVNILLDSALKIGIAALIERSCQKSKYTRFLYYQQVDQEQVLHTGQIKEPNWKKLTAAQSQATHIVTGVKRGIEFVIELKLPSNDEDTVKQIDTILTKIEGILKGDQRLSSLSADEKSLLGMIEETKVYSNIPGLNQITSVLEICSRRNWRKNTCDKYPPITYTLQTITCLYPQSNGLVATFISLPSKFTEKIEADLIKSSNTRDRLRLSLNDIVPPTLIELLQGPIQKAQEQWKILQIAYDNDMKYLQDLISDIRGNQKNISEIDQPLYEQNQVTLKDSFQMMIAQLDRLKEKAKLIGNLKKEHFDYSDVARDYADSTDDEQTVKNKLAEDDRYDRIFCARDDLKKKKLNEWESRNSQLFNEYDKNRSLRLLYADFSYCSFKLQEIAVITPDKKNNKEKLTEQKTSPKSSEAKGAPPPPPPSPPLPKPSNEIINILLLGESGVGKSTFINAFVNYLKFETFEDAQSSEPVVLIPVSFLVTTGNDFKEHIVKFGDSDSLNNENFDHPGQSVTQHCRSYVFKHTDGKKLRIIDTPGFGDTRGPEQDDLNMQHILDYINNLKYLNAICFLLKPNTSQINTFFQTCLTQLLELLGSDARQNITFCFTNARSTFYSPGDTAPLLKGILKSVGGDIRLKKENTFCFDNESFRYLVALQDSVRFDTDETKEYKMSWSTSVKESTRLADFISNTLATCHIQDGQKSIKHAQFEIMHMVRPILETIRNILRNNILYKMKPCKELIELCPTVIYRPASICLSCPCHLIQVSSFWIAIDNPHEIQDTCHVCECAASQHVLINYILRYKSSDSFSKYDLTKMNDLLGKLCLGSSKFAHFLINVARSTSEDLFLTGLKRIIRDEESICNKIKQSNDQNLQLVRGLKDIVLQYRNQSPNVGRNQQPSTFEDIYEWIKAIREYPLMREQMEAIIEGQKKRMEQYEYDLSKDPKSKSVNPINNQ